MCVAYSGYNLLCPTNFGHQFHPWCCPVSPFLCKPLAAFFRLTRQQAHETVPVLRVLRHTEETVQYTYGKIKVGLSPSKKSCVICLIESPLKMMKNAFYFILKTLFVLKIYKFLSRLFGHVGKTA